MRLTNERVGVFLARRSVQHLVFSINVLTLILEIIGQCDVKPIMTLPIKTTSVLKNSTNIITRPIRLTVIQVIMSVSTFITINILFIKPTH